MRLAQTLAIIATSRLLSVVQSDGRRERIYTTCFFCQLQLANCRRSKVGRPVDIISHESVLAKIQENGRGSTTAGEVGHSRRKLSRADKLPNILLAFICCTALSYLSPPFPTPCPVYRRC